MQWKYRIEAVEKVAAVEGVHGLSVARTSTFCGFINKKGCRNTNKPFDLEVCILLQKLKGSSRKKNRQIFNFYLVHFVHLVHLVLVHLVHFLVHFILLTAPTRHTL